MDDQFCFGDVITDDITSFKTLPVNITRRSPACDQASVTLTLTFEDNGTAYSEFMLAVVVSVIPQNSIIICTLCQLLTMNWILYL